MTINNNLSRLLEDRLYNQTYNRINYLFPDEDVHDFPNMRNGYIPCRDKYKYALEFFKAGAHYSERLLMAPNASGKTLNGGVEVTYHLTGSYPTWWEGRKYNRPIKVWVAAPDTKTTRDGVQKVLLGNFTEPGTGLIPKDKIKGTPRIKPGTPNAFESVLVKHTSGGYSELIFKSMESEARAFSAAPDVDIMWWDEEPSYEHYLEGLARILRTAGMTFITFTPDRGLSNTILTFFPDGDVKQGAFGTKYCVTFDMEDVPHFSTEEKKQFFDQLPPHLREAKYYGKPYAAAGRIYPLFEHDISISGFDIPKNWPRCFAMDVGWRKTACLWFALDKETNTWYIYDEYYVGEKTPQLHALAIKKKGAWIPGVCDPSAKYHEKNGVILFDQYREEGLILDDTFERKAVDSGITAVWQLLESGQLKVFRHLSNWWKEFRTYRRDEKGKIVDERDYHAMDCTRYGVLDGAYIAKTEPDSEDEEYINNDWKPKNSYVGGY